MEELDRTGAAVSLPLVAGGFKGQTAADEHRHVYYSLDFS